MPIQVLSPMVAAQIAAGEVVERPASIVKELIENALDAGARTISVALRGGGIRELRVQDDGSGIAADEVELAFERHATSKLQSADDLWALTTLGFRGEALPSVAAVAQVICTTRTAAEPLGTELRIAGSEIQARTPVGCPPGTTFSIRNLFYNIPVRREFLKSEAAEASAVTAIVTQYALGYPNVRWTLLRDERMVFQTSGNGDLRATVLAIYGVELARQLLVIHAEDEGMSIDGLVSPPALTRGSRDGMHLFVNRRAIQPRGPLVATILEAYHTALMKGRFPVVVLNLQVDPGAVDVNIHPTKSEVKFRGQDGPLVERLIGSAVRTALQGTEQVLPWRDTSAEPEEPGARSQEPEAARDTESGKREPEATSEEPGARSQEPEAARDTGSGKREPEAAPEEAGARRQEPGATRGEPEAAPEEAGARRQEPGATQDTGSGKREPWSAPAETSPQLPAVREQRDITYDTSRAVPPVRPLPPLPAMQRNAPSPATQHTLPLRASNAVASDADASDANVELPTASAAPANPPEPERSGASGLPALRPLAQLGLAYLLAEGPNQELYLVDQHAAHERITYERLMHQRGTGALESQALLTAVPVDLPPVAREILLDHAAELEAWGFQLAEDAQQIVVHAVPVTLALSELSQALIEVADHLSGSGGTTPHAQREAMLTTLACHTSVRFGQALAPRELQALLDQLGACEFPRTCPHGRPTVLVMTTAQIARQFGRLQ